MKNNQNISANRALPVVLPEKGLLKYVLRAFYSIKNFAKASILSIVILLIVFLLLSQMEQAYTMFLRMIENGKSSLLLCFILVFLLAIGLSHFPIYTYYASNLNGSRKYVEWIPNQPYNLPLIKKLKIYTFNPFFHTNYVKDIYSNILRQYLGLSLFLIWIHFIFSTFKPNLIYTVHHFYDIQIIVYRIASIPFIGYLILRRKLSKFHSTIEERRAIFIWLGKLLTITCLIVVIILIFIAFSYHLFSIGDLLVLLLATFFLMVSFTLFRLVRPRLKHTIKWLNEQGLCLN